MQTLIAHPNSPEQEKDLLDFLQSKNIAFETESNNIQLTKEQEKELDERIKNVKESDFVSWEKAKIRLNF